MRKKPILALLTVLLLAVVVVWYQPWFKVPLLLSQVSGTKLTLPVNTPDQSGKESQEAHTSQTNQHAKAQPPAGQTINFSYVDLAKAPQSVQKLAQQNREKEATALIVANLTPFIVATRGVKPTAGYGVEITRISREDMEGKPIINLKIKYTDPQPGQVTAQVLTYPVAIARVDLVSVPQGLVVQVERN